MAAKRLRTGFTTGACAAAAAKGATLILLGKPVREAELRLPWESATGSTVRFPLVGVRRGDRWASCGVAKDAGDDPDVTDGVEIRASVRWEDEFPGLQRIVHSEPLFRVRSEAAGPVSIRLEGGEGVGRVTRPGLPVPVGEPAINPVPRRMIEAAVREALDAAGFAGRGALLVVIRVPRGAELAEKTLNARLGILGGLSILGTTGIVIPMSADAWKATIDSALDVARAAGLVLAVLSHGRSSEAAAQQQLRHLPPEAFVLMGDHVGHALDGASARGLGVVLAGQFAKFCKVAGGHFETHVRDSALDLQVLAEILREAGFSEAEADRALRANTAREVFQRLEREGDRRAFRVLVRSVAERASARVQGAIPVEAILFGYDRTPLASWRCQSAGGDS